MHAAITPASAARRAASAPLPALILFAAAAGAAPEWRDRESATLRNHVQLTFAADYVRAGEAYFSPGADWIIFQAIPADEAGEPAAAHYVMYVAPLLRDAETGRVSGLGDAIQISSDGASSTCGFFHPLTPWRVIFGSTIIPPAAKDAPGYQRGQSRYVWMFPPEMEVVTRTIPAVALSLRKPGAPEIAWGEDARSPLPLWTRPGYDAECAYSPDGRFIVFAAVDEESRNPEIHIFDTTTGASRPIVEAPGYDGGPFFSPDGKRLCYRSDREGNDLLQIFVADLALDKTGAPIAVAAEHALTANEHVNWAPFWHPSGDFLVYTTSEIGHDNYEVFAIEAPAPGAPSAPRPLRTRRITTAHGFDGLPAFNADGSLMMWTSSRAGADPAQTGRAGARPAPHVWIAEFIADRP